VNRLPKEFPYLLPLVRGLVCGAKTTLGGKGARVFATMILLAQLTR
jgi:hypothetical protein